MNSRMTLPLLTILRMTNFAYIGIFGALLPSMEVSLHENLFWVSLVVSIAAIGWGISGFFLGPLTDRYGKRIFLVYGTLAMGLFCMLTAVESNFLLMVIFRFFGGVAGGAVGPASQAYVVEAFDPHAQKWAFGWLVSGYSLGGLTLMPGLLLIAGTWGWRSALLLLGATCLVLSVGLWLLFRVVVSLPNRGSSRNRSEGYRHALLSVLRESAAYRALLANLCERSAMNAVVIFFPVVLEDVYHLSLIAATPWVALLSAVAGLGAITGGRLPQLLHLADKWTYVGGILFGALMAGLGFWPIHDMSITITLTCIFGWLDGCVRPSYLNILARSVPSIGASMGWNALTNQAGGLIGISGTPVFVNEFGFGLLEWWIAGLLMISASFLVPISKRDSRPRLRTGVQ